MRAIVTGGTLSLTDGRGAPLLTARGETLLSDGTILSTDDVPSALEWRVDTTDQGVIVRLALRNDRTAPTRVEQLRPLVSDRGYRELPLHELKIQQTGWQSWSRAHPPAPFEPNAQTAAPPIRGPYLPHRRADSQLEAWMTILEPMNGPSLLLGFLSAHHHLGTIEIIPLESGGNALIAATELDGVELAPGAEVTSEPLLIAQGRAGELLDLYTSGVAERMQARPAREPVLTGWCSWYQLYTSVSEADVLRNIETLAAHRDQLPLQLVQLDDGYQHAVGDWLELNEKFSHGMRWLVERIRGAGFLSGLWLAPFIVSARSHTFAQHPDWVVRDEHGEPVNALHNWGSANYALDTTHPEALEWLEHVIHTVCADWGFEYLKLDFLYGAAMRGRRFDPHVTAVEAYRRGLELLRQVAGDRYILGCGAPLVPSVGLVDAMRIGSDVAAYWGAEGNADGPSLRNATRATLARGWMHGRWWTNDPDCLLVRASDTELALAEVEAWASVVALSGGMLFIGDDLSRVDADRLAFASRLWPPSGQAAQVGPPLTALMPERLHLRIKRAWAEWSIVGRANWSDAPATRVFDPRELGLDPDLPYHALDLWSGHYMGRHTGALDLGVVPPHGMRLLSIHPDLARPHTIGSTGHALGEAMDLAGESWNADTSVLTLVPSSHAPRTRRGEFLVWDPASGAVRRVPFSAAEAAPIHLNLTRP